MSKKKIVSYLLTIVLFAIFSLPMAGIEFVPLWLFQTRQYSSYDSLYYFSLAVVFLSLISPWVLLSMSIIFRTKVMRIRNYMATCLFAWAAVTQMVYLIMYFLSYYYNLYHYIRPYWP